MDVKVSEWNDERIVVRMWVHLEGSIVFGVTMAT